MTSTSKFENKLLTEIKKKSYILITAKGAAWQSW
jgi:hypothetical protein